MSDEDWSAEVQAARVVVASLPHPREGDTYDHYRGGDYRVLAVGVKEDTRQVLVAVRPVSHPERGVRFYELKDFEESVSLLDGSTRPRFLLLRGG